MTRGRRLLPGEIGSISIQRQADGQYRADTRARTADGTSKRIRAAAESAGRARASVMANADRAALTAKRSVLGALQTTGDVVNQRLTRLHNERSLKPQTVSEYERAIRPFLKSFASVGVHGLKPSELSKMLSEVCGGKPDRWRQALVAMRGALADAVQAGIVDRNVARELRPPRKKRKPAPALTEDHVAMLINEFRTPVVDPTTDAVIDRVDNQFSDAAILQFTSGARVGEICALRWEDITFEDESVVVTFRATVISRSGPARM